MLPFLTSGKGLNLLFLIPQMAQRPKKTPKRREKTRTGWEGTTGPVKRIKPNDKSWIITKIKEEVFMG